MALPSAGGFFKVLLRRTIENQKLSIPKIFAKEFGDELSHVVTLIVAAGDVWPVGLERAHKRIWFVDGWQKFAEHYSLTDGWFLVFSYHGNSTFHVRIYDFSCCDIEYPRVVQSIEHGEDVEGDIRGSLPSSSKGKGKCVDQHLKRKRKSVAIANSSKRAKLQGQRTTTLQDSPTRKNGYKVMFIQNIADYTSPCKKVKIAEERQKVIHATKMFELEHPFFAVILQPCNFDKGYMYVPSAFAKECMRGCSEYMKLEDSNEKQWDIKCSLEKTNRIRQGCGKFFRDNTLKNGDVCLFELIKRKDVVLKFSLLRAAEYTVMDGGRKKNREILGGTLYFSKKIKGMVKSRETEKAMKAAQALKIKNDAFMVILGSHNFCKCYVDVPSEFKDHLLGCDNFINLKGSGDKKWCVRCTYEPLRYTMRISTGFSAFSKENNLKEGDVCLFELIKSEAVELKVLIFHVSDYAKP